MALLSRTARLEFGPTAAATLIALTAVCFGLVPLFARERQALGLGSPAIALYRYVFSALVVLPFLPRSRRSSSARSASRRPSGRQPGNTLTNLGTRKGVNEMPEAFYYLEHWHAILIGNSPKRG